MVVKAIFHKLDGLTCICLYALDISIFTLGNIISNLLLVGKRSHVLSRILNSFSAIYDSTKFGSAFLKDAEHWGGLRHIGLLPPSSTFIVLDFVHQLCLEGIRTPRQVVAILLFLVDDRNLMIHFSKRWKVVWGTRQDVLSRFHPFFLRLGSCSLSLDSALRFASIAASNN